MPSSKSVAHKPAAGVTSAAEKTRSAIEHLQSKLAEVSQPGGTAKPNPQGSWAAMAESFDSEADLERQLAAYFAGSENTGSASSLAPAIEEMRKRVVDGVVDRILDDWSKPGGLSALREEVLERLIQRILQQFGTKSASREISLSHPR